MPTSPAPLAEALEIANDCLASRVRRLDRLVSRIYDGALRGTGVTGAQLSLLVAIQLAGPTTAAVVGRVLDLERSTVSRNLARLAAGGFIDARDDLRVTPRGTATIRACHPLWRRAQQQLRSTLNEAELRLVTALEPQPLKGIPHGKRRNA